VLEPFDLPITKGLQECIHEFERLDEEIELRPILDRLATRPPLDPAYGEDVEARLPEIVGSLSVALAHVQHHRFRAEESIRRSLAEVFSYFQPVAVAACERQSSQTSRRLSSSEERA
jgi:Domain of unknown function (DUF1931)